MPAAIGTSTACAAAGDLNRDAAAVNTAQPTSIARGMYGPSSKPSDTPLELGVNLQRPGASA